MKPKPDHSYYEYLPRIYDYIRAAGLSNDAAALYCVILIRYNANWYKPVAIPERLLLYRCDISHPYFIKLRKQLLSHRLITIDSDGVSAPFYTAELAPAVTLAKLPAPENVKYINSAVYKTREQLAREREAIAQTGIKLSRKERELLIYEQELRAKERLLDEVAETSFIAQYNNWKKDNA